MSNQKKNGKEGEPNSNNHFIHTDNMTLFKAVPMHTNKQLFFTISEALHSPLGGQPHKGI